MKAPTHQLWFFSHGDTATKTRSYSKPTGNILPLDGTPQHIVDEEMAMQSDMAERGRRLRAAFALKDQLTMKGAA